MPQVTIRMVAQTPRTHPKVVLRAGKQRVVLPFAPEGWEWEGLGREYQEIARPGRVPVAVDTGGRLPRVRWQFTVAYPDGKPIGAVLRGLEKIADRPGGKVAVSGASGLETGPWHVGDLRVTVTRRQHGTNQPVRAEVDLLLVGVTRVRTRIGRSR
jgi:hypothetical protein